MGNEILVTYKMIMFLKDFIEYKKICAQDIFILFKFKNTRYKSK